MAAPDTQSTGTANGLHLRLRIGILLAALAAFLVRLDTPLHGDHQWRQAHYMANITRFVDEGITLAPRTYNLDTPKRFYDFPLYQYCAALLSRWTGADPLTVARLLSTLLFLACFLALWGLLERGGLEPAAATWSLLWFASTPVVLHYFGAPMADDLALALSFASLLAFAVWRRRGGIPAFLAMTACGFLATLIKAPVHLPAFCAMAGHTAWPRPRELLRAPFLLHAGALVAALGTWFMIHRAVNVATRDVEAGWYFGSIADRFDPALWAAVLEDLATLVWNPLLVLLAAAGVWSLRSRAPAHGLGIGWLGGAVLHVALFLPMDATHNYYLLALAGPAALLAGLGAASAMRGLARAVPAAPGMRRLPPVLLALASLLPSWWSYEGLRRVEPPHYRLGTAAWLREHTRPDDFVFYLYWKPGNPWDPRYLYHARREGYNLPLDELGAARLDVLAARHGGGSGRVLIFAEPHLRPEVGGRLRELPRCELLVDGERGSIYRYRAPR